MYTVALWAATAAALSAQTFTTLYRLNDTTGADPLGAMAQGIDGNLYGTTFLGGSEGIGGTIFKITPSGALTIPYRFCPQSGCTGAQSPIAGLLQAADGDFYGTTQEGGANSSGAIFKFTPSGTLTTLYSFCSRTACADGEFPSAGLIQATDGNFYGTTSGGGAGNHGTIYKITPSGLTTLHSFNGADGAYPYAGLVQATNGDFYGTATFGETYNESCTEGCGTVFRISPSGALTTLHSFCSLADCADGTLPYAGLVQAADGNLYGTTAAGGARDGVGTVFKITSSGTLTTLYSFCTQVSCTDGDSPEGTLVQATDGNFYGTTKYGGANNSGTIFKITPSGKLTTLHAFCFQRGCVEHYYPVAGLVQATNGVLYGTTTDGGLYGVGTVFSLSVGLGAFVKTLTIFGKVGAEVWVLGADLTGASSVSFDGVEAVFEVVSSAGIVATVPDGARSGIVQVVTPGGTLSSNVPFRVLP